MLTVDTKFRRMLQAHLDILIESKRDEMERGLPDREYNIAVGYLRCLRMLASEDGPLEEIEREILEG